MKSIARPPRIVLAILPAACLVVPGCQARIIPRPPESLPPAYIANQITDPALQHVAEEIRAWGSRPNRAGGTPLYSRVDVLPPAAVVQPYGVGVFQQEVRLPVILITGPAWTGLKPAEKETAVAAAFREISRRLQGLNRQPALQPTLTVQTPQGILLTWINRLEPNGKNVHGDD